MANARLGVMLLSRILWRRSALSASQTACQASLINGHLIKATTFHSAHKQTPYERLFSTNVCLCREHTVQPESKTLDNLNEVAKSSKGNSPDDTTVIPGNDLVAEIMPYLTKVITEKSKFKSPSFKYLEGLVKILASFKLKGAEIVDCLSQRHHELNKIGHEVLVDKIGYLRTNGFHPAEVATLLKTRPNVLLMSKERIKESLQAYMGVGVVDGRIQVLLANEPELFDFSTSQIHQRVHDLHKYFSRKEIIEIVGSNPNVFQDSWENIEQKFKYVIQVMGLDVKHLKRFQVFDHSLLHMKIRHKFLYKAGLYQTPDKLGTTEIENPSITRIMDTPDKIFAIQVAGMSVAELEAFKKMEQFEDTLELLEYESSDSEDEHEDRSERISEHLNLDNFSEEELVTLERLAKYRASRL